ILLTSGMKENEAIEIMAEPDKIVIVKRKQQSLVEQLENYKGFYNATNEDKEWLESEPTGGELW
ncbi:MAG: hypothetical protein FWC47_17675, partial [Oscillospiraceae bacterium]|nr:hypothetical protein [Oscillospiraceae bacterium]